jgi:CubicO group peptidase (beta-lactamase class C family)
MKQKVVEEKPYLLDYKLDEREANNLYKAASRGLDKTRKEAQAFDSIQRKYQELYKMPNEESYMHLAGEAEARATQERLPLSEQASVQLASVSKTFTAAAVLYLYQHKYLDINDLVSTYIPSFPYKNISIKMLLNHRSGLPDYTHWAVPYANRSKRIFYNDDIIKLLASVKPRLDFPSNTHFKYSNTNYAVLAKLIEIVTEMPYKSFMQKYIFKPLGMEHTFVFDPADGLPASASISYKYNWQAEPVMFADGVYGDKGIYSTVRDMYNWDQSFYQNKLLNNETIELAYGPCSFEKAGVKNYGLGWRMLCFTNGNKIIYHNGWWHGNNTCFYRFIKENFTIIVLGNRFNKNIYKQPKVIYSIIKNTDASQGFDEDE